MPALIDLLAIALSTVGKVLLVAGSGLAISKRLKFSTSVKGVSFITVQIFLPCLLFTRLLRGLTLDAFSHLYWASLFGLLPIAMGFSSAKLLSGFMPVKYHGLLALGCTFQNAVSFPLSILISLRGVSWYDDAVRDEAQTYVFIYNISSSIMLWSLGTHIVKSYKAIEEEAEEVQKSAHVGAVASSAKRKACESEEVRSPVARVRDAFYIHVQPLLNPPLMASFVGIPIALSPLRHVFLSQWLEVLVGGMEILGAGTVPLTLFILGCNLLSADSSGVVLPKRFIAATCFVRLVLIPTIFFGALHLLSIADVIPNSRIFKLVMLVESIAPTAINSSVICSMHSYHTKEYTRTLLFQYIAAIASTSFWLTIILWYLG